MQLQMSCAEIVKWWTASRILPQQSGSKRAIIMYDRTWLQFSNFQKIMISVEDHLLNLSHVFM